MKRTHGSWFAAALGRPSSPGPSICRRARGPRPSVSLLITEALVDAENGTLTITASISGARSRR